MRATEFIRQLLDLIDNVSDTADDKKDYELETAEDCGCNDGETEYSNSPKEQYTSNDTIMSMGNDINMPKHPADIRVSSVALYPETAYKGK
jgi:hypothetical protein